MDLTSSFSALSLTSEVLNLVVPSGHPGRLYLLLSFTDHAALGHPCPARRGAHPWAMLTAKFTDLQKAC